jgi:hypothetical protein
MGASRCLIRTLPARSLVLVVIRGTVMRRPALVRFGVLSAPFFVVVACGGKAERARERSRNGQGGESATGGGGSATGGSAGVTGGTTSGGTSSGGSSGDAGAAGEPMGGSGGDSGCLGGEACAQGLQCDDELGCVRVCDAVGMDAVVLVTTQAELEDISNCNVIDGQLWIRGASITDLRPLGALRRVTEELAVIDCSELDSLAGFTSLERVGSLGILNNERLPSLDGLETLRAIGGGSINHRLAIADNPLLTSISALGEATLTVTQLELHGNAALTSLEGLPRVRSLEWLSVVATSVTSLAVFSALEQSGAIVIERNPDLVTLGLDVLEEVGTMAVSENGALERVGLRALRTSEYLGVNGNAVLSDLDLSALETVSRQLTINGNPVLATLGDLSTLKSVELIEISYNAALPQCEVDALDARLQACGDGLCEGNDTTATCD